MYFALNKATDFFKTALAYIQYLDYTCVAGTLCANPIYGLTDERDRKEKGKKTSVLLLYSH